MRRFVCAVALSMGMLMGCGGTVEMDTPDSPDTLGSVEQGLACAAPDNSCPSGTICICPDSQNSGLCRKPCPPSGICSTGAACLSSWCGPYCR
jgi:hypothetical protein